MRTYTVERGDVNYWCLKLYENGVEVGGGVGAEDDYEALVEDGQSFIGE